jgi:hypothetical protein
MKKKDMIKDAAELLEDMDDAFLDYTLEEFNDLEYAFDLIDRARTFLTDYLNAKAAP